MPNYVFVGSYDSNGVSEYMNVDPNNPSGSIFKTLSSSLLADINSKLPEFNNVVRSNPSWLKDGDILLNSDATFKITFVLDGAGFRNTIGYYFYDNNTTTITSVNDIDTIYITHPNFSKSGAGGAMSAGDTIQIASEFDVSLVNGLNVGVPTNYVFPAHTKIGFVLIPDA